MCMHYTIQIKKLDITKTLRYIKGTWIIKMKKSKFSKQKQIKNYEALNIYKRKINIHCLKNK